jgi:hypothetical protein
VFCSWQEEKGQGFACESDIRVRTTPSLSLTSYDPRSGFLRHLRSGCAVSLSRWYRLLASEGSEGRCRFSHRRVFVPPHSFPHVSGADGRKIRGPNWSCAGPISDGLLKVPRIQHDVGWFEVLCGCSIGSTIAPPSVRGWLYLTEAWTSTSPFLFLALLQVVDDIKWRMQYRLNSATER